MDNLNTLSILATDVTRLKTLAEERLKKLYGLEKVWFYIEEMTKVWPYFATQSNLCQSLLQRLPYTGNKNKGYIWDQ